MITYEKEKAIELSGLDKDLFDSILNGLKGKRIQHPFLKDSTNHTLYTDADIELFKKIAQHVNKGAYISEAYDYEAKDGPKPLYRMKKNFICKSFGVTSKYIDYIVQLLEAEGHTFNKTPYGAIKCYTIEDVEAMKEKMQQLANNNQSIGSDKDVSPDTPVSETPAKPINHDSVQSDKQSKYITLNVRATRPIRELLQSQEDADISIEKILEHVYHTYCKKAEDKDVQSDEMMDLFDDVLHFLQTKEKDQSETALTSDRRNKESKSSALYLQQKEADKRAVPAKKVRYYQDAEDEMLESLYLFAKENNGITSMNDYIKQKRKPSCWKIVSYFGSWRNALAEAGIQETYYRRELLPKQNKAE